MSKPVRQDLRLEAGTQLRMGNEYAGFRDILHSLFDGFRLRRILSCAIWCDRNEIARWSKGCDDPTSGQTAPPKFYSLLLVEAEKAQPC